MPRYYFDVEDRDGLFRDEVGLDLTSLEDAIAEARRALADMSKEALGQLSQNHLQIVIRDGNEAPVMLTVNLTTERSPK